MARWRTRPIHPFIERLMRGTPTKNDSKKMCSTLSELSEATGVHIVVLGNWADVGSGGERNGKFYRALYENCGKFGISVDEFIRGMLSIDSDEKETA